MRTGMMTAAAMALLAQAANADEACGPLKQIASFDTTPLPGTSVMTVDTSFNGIAMPMIVNTGASLSTLRESAMEPLKLHPVDNSRITLLSGDGTASKSYVAVDDFAIGAVHSQKLQFAVAPGSSDDARIAGSLGGDFLSLYDVELDFGGRKLNFFAKDHCPGHVMYWNPTAIAILPIQTQLATGDSSRTGFRSYVYRSVSVYVPVNLAGKDLQAQINTGSQASVMSAGMAKFQFGVTADSPGSVAQGDGAFIHTFPTLTFDTVTVTNAKFLVVPDLTGTRDPNNAVRSDSRIHRRDDNIGGSMSIGMDILRRLRLYIAFGEKKLYISPATAPVPAATPVALHAPAPVNAQ